MPRNFVLLFHEKQGTSPIVRLLDRFEEIDVVHLRDGWGWEPFDEQNCGSIRLRHYIACLDLVLGRAPLETDRLDRIYRKTARAPLAPFDKSRAVGFKMRLEPHRTIRPEWRRRRLEQRHREATLDALARHAVFVFVASRRDLLRWALSFYHGDGTGPGHPQFAIAAGELRREDMPPIRVDCDALALEIARCRDLVESDRRLLEDLAARGIEAAMLEYEEFCAEPARFLTGVLHRLGIEPEESKIEAALEKGPFFEKVHSEDFSQFVINHDEVAQRFAHELSS